jgi:hypothetical protein
MEITFYKKAAPLHQPTSDRKPSLKPKNSTRLTAFKGLTLREYFEKTAEGYSDNSLEKETASLEGGNHAERIDPC